MAAMPTTTTAVLEHCQVTPPPDAKAEQLLHLTHSDIWWLPSIKSNHARSANEFHGFVSHQFPPLVNHSPGSIKIPPFAIQITLFPNKGICIGFTIHHSLCDGAALLYFIKTWASIIESNSDAHAQWLPFYDITTFQDLDGLDSIRWNQVKVSRPTLIPTSFSNNKVRATFVMSKDEVQKLKDVVLERRPNMAYVSTFTVACAHVWISIAKLADVVEVQVADNEPEYFIFFADCRGAFKSALAWEIFWEPFGSNESGNESWRIETK
ncbi:hypothetical protein RD792_005981 [Penstemon davidsonii]|uniref:Uncharacterized protein n=1 Tax=Penstemon davidsonii TaxID=160366 RepID=A0ABR0DX25_9LAMI|nr:hypothetical protein RD792_005981 [Penstemon davidsonii]